jgi:hypothetical protein
MSGIVAQTASEMSAKKKHLLRAEGEERERKARYPQEVVLQIKRFFG